MEYKRAWQPTPVFLPGEFHGQRSLMSYILSMGLQEIRHNWSDLACMHSQLWRKTWQSTPMFLPGKSHGQRSLVGYSLWGHKWAGHNLSTQQPIADLQCCNGFRWTAKGLGHTCTCIHSPPNSAPIQAVTWHWAEFPGLHSRSLLGIHRKYSRVCVSIPNFLTVPSPCPSLLQP